MVVLLDLDDDPHLFRGGDHSAYDRFKHQLRGPLLRAGKTQDVRSDDVVDLQTPTSAPDGRDEDEERPNPNLNGFSAALSCYP